jgi:hypothetical protein
MVSPCSPCTGKRSDALRKEKVGEVDGDSAGRRVGVGDVDLQSGHACVDDDTAGDGHTCTRVKPVMAIPPTTIASNVAAVSQIRACGKNGARLLRFPPSPRDCCGVARAMSDGEKRRTRRNKWPSHTYPLPYTPFPTWSRGTRGRASWIAGVLSWL